MKRIRPLFKFYLGAQFAVLFFFFQLIPFFSNAQLKPDFTVSQKSGCAPLVVQFKDSSMGNPSSWKWNLGNGTTSVLQNPSVAYFEPGTYTVQLIIKNIFGKDSITKKDYITVYGSPVINFSASALTGCFPLETRFTDLSSAGSGSLTKWQWDFGDGNFAENENPAHTYTSSGNFNVSLKATNSNGCITSKTVPGYIHINTGVKADFSNSTSASCSAPVNVNFFNKSTGSGILTYQWNFGDGATSILTNPSHTYTTSGSYTVTLTVTNSSGCTDILVKQHLVTVGETKADFSVPALACAGSPVVIKNTSNPASISALWNFSDGTKSSLIDAVKVFDQPGNFSISLISNSGACKDSITKNIQVVAKPTVDFTAFKTVSCSVPFMVSFTNSSNNEGGNSFFWDFGDGSNSKEQNPKHTYNTEGNYSVKLFVTNASGCTDSLVKTDFIKIKIPVVTIENLPQKDCAPLSHTFNAVVNSVEPVIRYQWIFGDGTSSDAFNPTHVYTKPGKYTVALFYTTKGGCTDSVQVTDGIIVGTKPAPKFIADPLNTCAFQEIHFTDQSGGNPNEWVWFFGDGGSSTIQNPAHQYADTGLFDVTLIALNNGCADTITYPKHVHIHPPVAAFSFEKNCNSPKKIQYTDHSIGADYWNWNFGDGTTSNEKNPSHEFATPGIYAISLTVTNKITGCSETKIDSVNVIKEIANFALNENSLCKKIPLGIQAINSNPQNISSYTWKFGDGAEFSDSTNSVNHQFSVAGTYNISLIIKDINGCLDSITKLSAVRVFGPTASFNSSVAGICLNSAVNFADSSFSDGIHKIEKWNWNWGDGKMEEDSIGPFSHSYSSPGNYSVLLIITDSKGCTDTLRKPGAIIVSKPVAAFYADSLSCTGQGIQFQNSSSGPGLKYEWSFGDGTRSVQKNPIHLYPREGSYSASLKITDQYGCGNSISKINYITIANPKAGFMVSDSVGTCPPLIVHFTNQSVNYSKWVWNFGDGTTSTEQNPSHFYSSAGTFYAVLTITGPGGCSSIVKKKIKVDGPSGSFTYQNIIGCAPLATGFKAQTKNNSSFIWDFNDGNTISSIDSNVVHQYKTPGKYLPKMILRDVNGCQVPIPGKDSITVFGVKASFTHNGELVCDSNHVNFSNKSISNDEIVKYVWNFGDGSHSLQENPFHSYKESGIYKTSLVTTTKRGCIDSIENVKPVKVNRSPQISISGNVGECVSSAFHFAGILSNPDTSTVTWRWDLGNGNFSSQKDPESQKYPRAGKYTVKVIGYSTNGCNDTATKSVEIYPLPMLSVTADSVVCFGSSETLKASGAESYSWSPSRFLSSANSANPVSRPDSAIQYFVKGTSSKGCVSIDSVSLNVKYPFRLSFSKPDTLCIGRSVQLHATGTEKYSWSPATGLDNPFISSPTASPNSSTIYQVIGMDSKGCFKDTAYIPVKVYPYPTVDAGEDKTINVSQQVQLIPKISKDVTAVTWTPSTAIVSRNFPSITVQPNESIEYTVEVKNEGGCRAQDRVSVYVLCNNANVFMPNTFSPNGDGTNDIFYPRGSGVFKILSLKVFNRWGQMVYDRSNINPNDASTGWDGTYKGKPLSPDVFVFVLQVICDNNSVLSFKGNIALIK